MNGGDPNDNVGMPLCENHHVRNQGDEPFDRDASFHPDIGEAYKQYHEWKRQEQHMNSITGRKRIDYSTSPFAEATSEHRKKAKKGERYITGTNETDEFYRQVMMDKEFAFNTLEGEMKPKSKHHPKTDRSKRGHWTDHFFDEQELKEFLSMLSGDDI